MNTTKGVETMRLKDHLKRVDSKDKLNGRAKYIEDYYFDDMLYAKTLRSEIPCGEILSIDYPKDYPNVYVIDGRHVIKNNHVAMIEADMPIFAEDKVTYLGEPIALICGEDKDEILEFMEKIKIHYTEKKGHFTLDGQVFTHQCFEKGQWSELDYDYKVEESYETGYQEQLYMEKQGFIGLYEDEIITIMGSLQCPYYILNALKHGTGFDESRLRVIQTTTGGAFGGKEEYPSLVACQLAMATYHLKRPIKLIFDRREDMAFTTKRHPSKTLITSYLKDHKIIGMKIDIKLDAGSYLGLSDVVLQRAMLTMTGAYNIPMIKVEGRTYKTNNVFTGAFRGFGAPQSLYALELHMTHLAKDLGEDPLGFRQKHFVKKGDLTATSGIFNENIELNKMVHRLKEMSAYDAKGKKAHVGYGVSVVPHGGGFTGDGEATHIKAVVRLRKEKDGQITILVSNVEMGQGAQTTFTKIVQMALDIDLDKIRCEIPDTFKVPDSGPTVASRTTMVVGQLVYKACQKIKKYLNEEGVHTVEESFKNPDYITWNQETLTGNAYMAYSWSVLLAKVVVDPLTYEVSCTDLWGVYDVGQPIDEKLLLGQIHGGMVQGLGYALTEYMTSKSGAIEHFAFSSYAIPTTMDIPKMHTDWIINHYMDGPFGAKAAGELTLVGVAPAIAAAIEDAFKIKSFEIPMIPEKIERILSHDQAD